MILYETALGDSEEEEEELQNTPLFPIGQRASCHGAGLGSQSEMLWIMSLKGFWLAYVSAPNSSVSY